MTRPEFKLHSKGENWFHFRKDLNSAMESFSVTFCHDGTVCMTGDYGCLCWRRSFFPETLDYGFPNKETGIGYFAEKVVRAHEDQRIRTWSRDLAIKEITETIADEEYGWSKEDIEGLKKVLDDLPDFEDKEYGQFQMTETFNDLKHPLEMESYADFGECYTDGFKMRFEMLQAVSDIIILFRNLVMREVKS